MESLQLNDSFKELKLINVKLEKRVRYYETTALNLTVAYILFQVLFLHSASIQSLSKKKQCNSGWVPYAVSMFCSFIFFLSFSACVTRYCNTRHALDLNSVELMLINQGTRPTSSSSSSINFLKPDDPLVRLYKRRVYITIIVSALIGFTAVVLSACRSILCNSNGSSAV
ncbi:hypothetical protein ACOSP7_027603 [Xanthoceras sorbifolium]|uniref:Uncharacterized protein n=1 Tax=Xanthoceras sorbifolium TaxID=99658 RepID=A0ABQ8HGK1_9ROSI|nr:hypothetical protein JRO89_XS11G0210300 [Xanthoceras sorbifolium]